MTFFIAGHETTANALSWTWYLLSKYPMVLRRLEAELAEMLGGRPPTAADMPKLSYTLHILQEAMRLYPPAWMVARMPLADDEIGGYHIPAESVVVMSQYVTHRHPDFWENPEGFDPERMAGHPSAAYFPFGGGPRSCIGEHFALLEADVLLRALLTRFRVESLAPVTRLAPLITLRPAEPVPVILRAR
jgi:cytochrome P450